MRSISSFLLCFLLLLMRLYFIAVYFFFFVIDGGIVSRGPRGNVVSQLFGMMMSSHLCVCVCVLWKHTRGKEDGEARESGWEVEKKDEDTRKERRLQRDEIRNQKSLLFVS